MHQKPYIEKSHTAAKEGSVLPQHSVQNEYMSQLQTSPELRSWKRSRQGTALDRILLRPEVIDFAAKVTDRIAMAARPTQAASGSGAGSMQDFISQKENKALVEELISAADLEGSAEDFASFADANDRLLNGSEAAVLIQRAQELKEAGAVDLLGDELRWQCKLITNIEKIVEWLQRSP